VIGVLLLKAATKLKFLLPVLKVLGPILKTGGTMFATIWVYALTWGWWYAAGFVLLIFVHELGHLVAARWCGIKVGAPVFIPFMGAFIALKEEPPNAWVEAVVGIGGPLMGTLGAAVCAGVGFATGQPLFLALAYSGFLLNLFNLTPIGFLDGGRIATAISPLLWVVGVVIMVGLLFYRFHFIILLILILSVTRLISLFRGRSPAQDRYFEVTPAQRWIILLLYFGLAAFLALAMQAIPDLRGLR
jgi:Zn-dependent protease